MPLKVRSIVPYAISGVLALIGWWWYTTRKKELITSHDREEPQAMGLLASPGEGSNGMVDKGCLAASVTQGKTCRDRPEAKEQKPGEQEVIAQVHAPATKATAGEPLSSLSASVPSRKLDTPSQSSRAPTDFQQSDPEIVRQIQTSDLLPEKNAHKRPAEAAVSDELNQLSREPDSVRQHETAHKEEPNTKASPAASLGAELAKTERPEPEGEVAEDVLAVSFAENVQSGLVKDSLSTKDDLPTTNLAVNQRAQAPSSGPESPVVPASFPLSASTPASDGSVEAQRHENRDVGQPAGTSDSLEELHRLAAGLISEVISAATQEVMEVSSCEASKTTSSSTITLNGKETTKEEDHHASQAGSLSPSHADGVEQRTAQIAEEVINGCLAPSVWEKSEDEQQCVVSSQGQLESSLVLPKLQAEEAVTVTEDSGCSTCQSEDGVSTEDLLCTGLSSAVPETKEDLIQISGISRSSEEKEDGLEQSSDLASVEEPTLTAEHVAAVCGAARLNGTGLGNGTSEAEADQSGGERPAF